MVVQAFATELVEALVRRVGDGSVCCWRRVGGLGQRHRDGRAPINPEHHSERIP